MELDQLPFAYRASRGRRSRKSVFGSRYDGVRRRGFLQGVAAVGTAVGFGAMGLFRVVRDAQAENPPWTSHPDCGIAGGYDPGTCDDPCYGPAFRDNGYCATCAEAANFPNNLFQWHFQGSRTSGSTVWNFSDLPGDICPSPGTDAWVWDVSDCTGSCAPDRRYRCHDGQKKKSTDSTWSGTVCEGWVRCNGSAYNPC